jgi:hypothetical protein
MKILKPLLICLLILALAQAPQAVAFDFSNLGTNLCNTLFNSPGIGSIRAADYTQLLSLSLLIVIMMITLLGVIYGLGMAFGIESLKRFAKTEVFESFFNLVFIFIIASGLVFADNLSVFFTNLAQLTSSTVTPVTASTPILQQNCANYLSRGVGTAVNGMISLLGLFYITNTLNSLEVDLIPNGVGIQFNPFGGWYPYIQLLNLELDVFFVMGGILASVGLFMFALYFLFPVFLYAGILLRSFPWTRAAGGSLLAFFIGFYIIFPALLYPFSAQSFACIVGSGTSTVTVCATPSTPSNCAISPSNFANPTGFLPCLSGGLVTSQLQWFSNQISYSVLQVFGVVVAILISFDLVEKLGDVLGAPSVHARSLLSKVL